MSCSKAVLGLIGFGVSLCARKGGLRISAGILVAKSQTFPTGFQWLLNTAMDLFRSVGSRARLESYVRGHRVSDAQRIGGGLGFVLPGIT